ncbi:MAG TPA: sulfotransferase [Balneolaceae bacterium]|nr:sulfotransferase [Balneolaceae bacterium]
MQKPSPSILQHPLMGAKFSTLLKTFKLYNGPSFHFLPHFALLLGSAISRTPFRLIEQQLLKKKRYSEIALIKPVFIVGFWRSGTTHLHNLLGRAPGSGIITPLASGLPGELLTLGTWLEPLLKKALPETREIDRVAVTPKSPQEDEIPVANLQLLSVFHALYFPGCFRKNFNQGVFFDNVSPKQIEEWKEQVQFFLKKIVIHQDKQPLIIKNPVYTTRMKYILEMWPDARFIHIYRNPYRVFPSAKQYFQKMLSKLALQPYDPAEIEPVVVASYLRMLDQLYDDASGLPKNQFTEVRFEDLEANPIPELQRIYSLLELSDWNTAKYPTQNYLNQISDYKKNKYDLKKKDIETVQNRWKKYLDKWQYDIPV